MKSNEFTSKSEPTLILGEGLKNLDSYISYAVHNKQSLKEYKRFNTQAEAETFAESYKNLTVLEHVDIDAIQQEEMRQTLLQNPELFESSVEYSDLTKFLLLHSTPTPVPGKSYVYASVQSMLPGRIISYIQFDEAVELAEVQGNSAYFIVGGKVRPYPYKDSLATDMLKKIFMFTSLDEAEKFKVLLTMRYSDWKFTSKVISTSVTEDEDNPYARTGRIKFQHVPMQKPSKLQVLCKEKGIAYPNNVFVRDGDDYQLAHFVRAGEKMIHVFNHESGQKEACDPKTIYTKEGFKFVPLIDPKIIKAKY